jgi:O-antigen/teichoic acid export membrane protein
MSDSSLQFADELGSPGKAPSAPAQITSRRLMAGTLGTLVNRLSGLFLAFFLTPFVVQSIGVEAYGLWAIVGSAVNYFALLDCGVGSSFVKYLAEFLERREHDEVRHVMTFGFLFYLALGLIILPLVQITGPRIVSYLRLDPQYISAASNLLLLAVAYFVVANMFGVFGSFIMAMQRTEIVGLIDTGYQAVYAISLILMLRWHYGVYALPYAIFCACGATALIKMALVYQMFGSPWRNPFRLERDLLKRILKFGLWMQVNALTGVINLETDRIILGTFVSVISAGYYELGNRLAALARILPSTLLAPLMPAAAAIDGRQQGDRLNIVYVRGTRYLALTTFIMAGFLIGAGTQVLRVWMGRTYPYVTMVMAALLISFAINNLTGVGTMIVRATAQPYYETYYAVLATVVNIVFTLILTPFFGLMGVIAGTVIGTVSGSIYFLWLFHKLRGLGWRSTLFDWLWRLALGTTVASYILWNTCRLCPASWFASRTQGAVSLAFLGTAYLAVSFICLWLLGFWGSDDFALIDELMPNVLGPQFNRFRAIKS